MVMAHINLQSLCIADMKIIIADLRLCRDDIIADLEKEIAKRVEEWPTTV